MITIQELIDLIIEGIQEKKGHRVSIADLSDIPSAPAEAFVICTGNNPAQVDSIVDSIENVTRVKGKEHPTAIAGRQNSVWVAMDYGNVMVHVFVPDMREYYDIDNLWSDAKITQVPDLDCPPPLSPGKHVFTPISISQP